MVIDDIFKENVKNSFKKAREHMDELEIQIKEQNKEITALKDKIEELLNKFYDYKLKNEILNDKISTGNEGVLNKQTNKQTVKQTNKQLNKQTIIDQTGEISKFQLNIEEYFRTLTKQELLVFLTIYQLEEELNRKIKFLDISSRLNLSESCIRGYIKRLLQKGMPLVRTKINNKIVLISLSPGFRDLNLKNKLSDIYYESDSEQTKLFDNL